MSLRDMGFVRCVVVRFSGVRSNPHSRLVRGAASTPSGTGSQKRIRFTKLFLAYGPAADDARILFSFAGWEYAPVSPKRKRGTRVRSKWPPEFAVRPVSLACASG